MIVVSLFTYYWMLQLVSFINFYILQLFFSTKSVRQFEISFNKYKQIIIKSTVIILLSYILTVEQLIFAIPGYNAIKTC